MKNYLIDGKNESERLNFQNKMDICDLDLELNHYKWNRDHRVLDAGCGNGNLVEKLIQKEVKHIDGIDFSDDRIADAKKRFSHLSNVRFFQGSLEETNLEAASYDTVVCRYIYEHLTTPALVLKELNRLLKPDGTINIINFDDMVFNFHTKNEAFNKELKKAKSRIPQDLEIGRKLPQLLKQNGYDRVEWEAVTYFFQGERLELEKTNSKMRFEQGRENLSRYFDSMKDYEVFVDNYMNELNDDCNVLSSSKFLIKARKKA